MGGLEIAVEATDAHELVFFVLLGEGLDGFDLVVLGKVDGFYGEVVEVGGSEGGSEVEDLGKVGGYSGVGCYSFFGNYFELYFFFFLFLFFFVFFGGENLFFLEIFEKVYGGFSVETV